LLVRYFNHIKQKHFFYIPDRVNDGYGASKKLFQRLIIKKPKLIIMVDCGSTSIEAIDYLNQHNIKSIIIDHHEINKPYPKSDVIINPKKNTTNKEDTLLCATALTYFFLDNLIKKNNSDFKLSNYLIYVLLATVCDVMPLRKINKIIAHNTLKDFNLKNNTALNFIFDHHDIKRKITVEDLGFLIGPIINAGGRLNCSKYGVELLSSDDNEIIKDRSLKLINLNNKRKKIEQNILDEIDFEKIKSENKHVVIYYKDNLNEGLIGIIASRLKEYFNKPSIVITNSNNILKASARSTSAYNMGHLIRLLIEKNIIENGGGHNMAAGFTLKKNNIELLVNFIHKDYLKKNSNLNNTNKYDGELSISAINLDFMNELNKLKPFGNLNHLPFFLIKNVKIIKMDIINNKHISTIIKPDIGSSLKTISSSAIQKNFIKEINKLGPFGNFNFLPTFLIKDVKITKFEIINNKHISVIIKPKIGPSIKSICFNCLNTKIGEYLISYKKKINIIGQIHENIWNNKKTIQLNIKDLIL
jgi:single-stranded-DNA-specific exonuclease